MVERHLQPNRVYNIFAFLYWLENGLWKDTCNLTECTYARRSCVTVPPSNICYHFSAEREARQNMLTNEEKEILIEQAKLEREKNRQAKLEKRQKQQEYQNILYR